MSHNGLYGTREELLAAVEAELADPDYTGRDHHDLHTYNEGCRGPLCRKRSRDYGRERYRSVKAVPAQEHHRPTVRTQWDALLAEQPTRLEVSK